MSQRDSAAEDWREYSQLEQLINHWDRPGWTPTRHSYHWLIALDDPALQRLVERCQAGLGDLPMLDLVPLSSLHVTLERVGFADELTEDEACVTAGMTTELCRETARLRGGEERSQELPSRFIPHVSIAYCGAVGPAQPVIARVGPLRELGSVEVPVVAMQLVDMWREGRAYQWRELAAVALGEST